VNKKQISCLGGLAAVLCVVLTVLVGMVIVASTPTDLEHLLTPEPLATWALEATPTDPPAQVVPTPVKGKILQMTGTGETLTDKFSLPPCPLATFSYLVTPDNLYYTIMGVTLVNTETGRRMPLVQESWTDLPSNTDSVGGHTMQALAGGDYYLQVEVAPTDGWIVIAKCPE